ncbi:MAG TPA: 2Fe-2S iron-sulfur cluster-binding protein [Pirellulales bacterium]
MEGLAKGDERHPVQRAFMEENAYQCGYCIPGMIMGTVALLKEKPKPSDEEIRNWLSHQICRCCGYPRILNAVHRAAKA